MKTQLRKVKWNKGQTENGQTYDYTRIYVEAKVYDKSANEFGVDVVELEFGSEADHVKLEHLRGKLPVDVNVEWETQIKGKNEIKVVTRLDFLKSDLVKAEATKA